MDVTRENIEDYIRNEECLKQVHSTMEFSWKWMDVARENIKDYMRNEEFILKVH